MSMSDATTRGVRVSVNAEFDRQRSRPAHREWFFRYTITITNQNAEVVQLLSRHWIITHADGRVEEVRGLGVVGLQPALDPGESFTYTSGANLPTSTGRMEGTYQMAADSGQLFDVRIAPFTLEESPTIH